MWRELVHTDNGHSKFWRVLLVGKTASFQWGRIGTEGQKQTKSFWTASDAESFVAAKIDEKLGKGYRHHRAYDADPTRSVVVNRDGKVVTGTRQTMASSPGKTRVVSPEPLDLESGDRRIRFR